MGKSVNKVILLGNIVRDPEMRSTPGGSVVANFSLATNERFKDSDGEWKDRAEFHNLVAFGKTAEIIRDYVKKGNKLYVEGKIQTRSWDDKETGAKRYRTEVIVNELTLLSSKSDGGESHGDGRSYQRSGYDQSRSQGQQSYQNQESNISDDDIPF